MQHYSMSLIPLSLLAVFATGCGASTVPPVDPSESEDRAHQESAAWAKLSYCILVALWTTFYMESWKRKNEVREAARPLPPARTCRAGRALTRHGCPRGPVGSCEGREL